jgi:ATP-binding cassette subfamily C protein LapB
MGGLVACSILSGRVMGPFAQIAQLITRLHHTMSAYRELNRIMDLPVERTDTDSFLHRPRLDGSIEFRDVTFSYPGSKLPALKGLNLRIAAGERVGIVGRTGSGKSTLGKLIMSLYTPDQGSVLVDGADLRQVDPTDLRRWTGYMPQDVALFQGTVRQNISMAHPQASDQEILHAARISGTHDFMSTHPQGYALHVGERGSTLSGGQRQAISIARALLRDPRILVMDEPSSSMDSQSEALLLQRLKFVLDAKTLVLITHRPSLLELVDRLVVIDDGRVVADGPKEAIMRQLQSGGVPVNQTVQRQTGVRQ